MKTVAASFLLALFFTGCDDARVYEQNHDFARRFWHVNDTTAFEFTIGDSLSYNLYCNVRNTLAFPYSRLFINYALEDSSGKVLQKKMVQTFLFDRETGKPFGTSGLGDIYDHQIPLLKNQKFPYAGKYRVGFKHYMRTDTLPGILSVGLRVEKAQP